MVQESMGSLGKNGQSYHSPVNECHRGSKVEMLYDIDDPPSHHAFEIVLNIICEEIGSNAEPATLLFLKVLALAERNKVDLSHWKLNRMPDWVMSSGKQGTETS